MSYRELFEAELDEHRIIWCLGDKWRYPAIKDGQQEDYEPGDFDAEWVAGPCDSRRSRGGKHSPSGGAWATEYPSGAPTIHMGRAVTTRYGLQIALHEVGHVVLGHTSRTSSGRRTDRRRVYEREAEAEEWSFYRMSELGVPVPEKARERARLYVSWKKARGDRVIAARNKQN